jgi:hypothetical protein
MLVLRVFIGCRTSLSAVGVDMHGDVLELVWVEPEQSTSGRELETSSSMAPWLLRGTADGSHFASGVLA